MYPWLVPLYEKLQERVENQQLHHGLLFVADQGAGEKNVINGLAKTILCVNKNACGECKSCKLYIAHSHPDMKRVISDKPSIGVDLIRQVSEFVTSTSQLLGNKVVLIENIESMTESASNSLLKTLEEPNQNTYILLSTTKPNALLATITSRCEKIRIAIPSAPESLDWLAKQTAKTVTSEGLKAYGGSPIDYLASLNEDTNSYAAFCADLEQLAIGGTSELLLAEKCKNEAETILAWLYQKAVSLYQNNLETTESTSSASISQAKLQIEKLIFDCQKANKKIGQAGINKSLILQQLFQKYKSL